MKLFRRTLLVALLLTTFAVSDERNVDFDQQTNFSQFKTFALGPGRIGAKTPELNSSLIKDKIEAAIRNQLMSKGLEEVAKRPDLMVTYSLGAANKSEVERWVGPRGRRWTTGVNKFTEGTLVVDLRERDKRQLVWRGVYRDDEKDAAKVSRKLDEDVKKLFDKYPVKK